MGNWFSNINMMQSLNELRISILTTIRHYKSTQTFLGYFVMKHGRKITKLLSHLAIGIDIKITFILRSAPSPLIII